MAVEAGAPQQYWLDMERPIQPRPPRERRVRGEGRPTGTSLADTQMTLTMTARPAAKAPIARPAPPPHAPAEPAPEVEARPCFVTWLRDQSKRRDAIGELAKAVRIDPAFPRAGSADDVRSRFDKVGADGDAFAALEDAERAYDRAA
jgi:hypothetical protein